MRSSFPIALLLVTAATAGASERDLTSEELRVLASDMLRIGKPEVRADGTLGGTNAIAGLMRYDTPARPLGLLLGEGRAQIEEARVTWLSSDGRRRPLGRLSRTASGVAYFVPSAVMRRERNRFIGETLLQGLRQQQGHHRAGYATSSKTIGTPVVADRDRRRDGKPIAFRGGALTRYQLIERDGLGGERSPPWQGHVQAVAAEKTPLGDALSPGEHQTGPSVWDKKDRAFSVSWTKNGERHRLLIPSREYAYHSVRPLKPR